jgi:hypothetical protein
LFPKKIGNYSKGLPHNQIGEVNLNAYKSLIHALKTGNLDDFEDIPLGGVVKLTDPQAGCNQFRWPLVATLLKATFDDWLGTEQTCFQYHPWT